MPANCATFPRTDNPTEGVGINSNKETISKTTKNPNTVYHCVVEDGMWWMIYHEHPGLSHWKCSGQRARNLTIAPLTSSCRNHGKGQDKRCMESFVTNTLMAADQRQHQKHSQDHDDARRCAARSRLGVVEQGR